ncbi:hypothetical protein D9M73_174080 [compost metagenome]
MQVDLLTRAQGERRALQGLQLHGTAEHRYPASAAALAHAGFALTDGHLTEPGLDHQGRCTRHLQRHFALHQFHPTIRQIHIDGAGRIELQDTAIGQAYLLALAGGGVQVGAPDVQGQLPADQPGCRHQRHRAQCAFEHYASRRIGAIEAAHGQRGRQVGKALAQGLGLLPGVFMTAAAVAPALQVRPVLIGGTSGLEQRQPLRGGAHGLANVGRRAVHRSTNRQCS